MKIIGLTVFILISLSSVFAQEARKVDEFGLTACDELKAHLQNLMVELNEQKDAKGFIVIYVGRLSQGNKTTYPRQNEAKAEIKNIKTRLMFFNFDESRIVFVEGGFRERYTIELWFVPANATPPKPTPTLKTMKYRKGKATRLCGE